MINEEELAEALRAMVTSFKPVTEAQRVAWAFAQYVITKRDTKERMQRLMQAGHYPARDNMS